MEYAHAIFAFVLAFGLPLLVVHWYFNGDWRSIALLVAVVLNGWFLMIGAAITLKYAHDADVFERENAGVNVPYDDATDDGLGLNAAALLFGWVVPVLGAGAGQFISFLTVRRERRRGFPVAALPVDEPHTD